MRGWLKEKRNEKRYTMAQMASMLGITESYYSMIEAGDRQKKMDLALAAKFSVVFGTPVEKIIELENQEGGE